MGSRHWLVLGRAGNYAAVYQQMRLKFALIWRVKTVNFFQYPTLMALANKLLMIWFSFLFLG